MMKICSGCPLPLGCDRARKCMAGGFVPEPKPPLGLIPHRVWVQRRILDILQAMSRYLEADQKIPQEWIDELRDHNE